MSESARERAALEALIRNNARLERLEALVGDFSPFVAMEWTEQEARHSSFHRWFLDPAETHGLGAYYRESTLEELREGVPRLVREFVERDLPELEEAMRAVADEGEATGLWAPGGQAHSVGA